MNGTSERSVGEDQADRRLGYHELAPQPLQGPSVSPLPVHGLERVDVPPVSLARRIRRWRKCAALERHGHAAAQGQDRGCVAVLLTGRRSPKQRVVWGQNGFEPEDTNILARADFEDPRVLQVDRC